MRLAIVAGLASILFGLILLVDIDTNAAPVLPFDCLPSCIPPMECQPDRVYFGSTGSFNYSMCDLGESWPCRRAYHFHTTTGDYGALYTCAPEVRLGDILAYYGQPTTLTVFKRSVWLRWDSVRVRVWSRRARWIMNPYSPINMISFF